MISGADEEATALIRARYCRLLRMAYLLTGDTGYAEDLAQTTLAKAVVSWSRLRRAGDIDSYLHRTLVNMFLRARRRRSWWELPISRMIEAEGQDSYAVLDRRDWLRHSMDDLPARQRAAVVLRFYQDLSEQDTARALGCSVATVRHLFSRGLHHLHSRVTNADAAAEPEVRYA